MLSARFIDYEKFFANFYESSIQGITKSNCCKLTTKPLRKNRRKKDKNKNFFYNLMYLKNHFACQSERTTRYDRKLRAA
ncbi:MAG: hypothetical protein C4548_00260 [Desulfobacteraceae bacterium]|nr:MAG: hypothetical protein C4548_00260 [Desulfobacteraceae bacterium]